MKEKCGIFGIYAPIKCKCVKDVVKGLKLLQHRGYEGCGITYYNDKFIIKKGIGMVKDVFRDYQNNDEINHCIGHVRYSTSGKSKTSLLAQTKECQPLYGSYLNNEFYLAHNGNIPNIQGHDSYHLVKFIENNVGNFEARLIHLINTIPGVYCLLIITKNYIYAIRDKFGVRPLCIGYQHNNYCVSSESCALHKFNHLMDVKPGEIIRIGKDGLKHIYRCKEPILSICAFEFIYFLKPNSYVDGYYVKNVRKNLGKVLAQKEFLQDKDYIVVGVPDSGIIAARGYADYLNYKYIQFIEKYKEAGRTFILPSNSDRILACSKKFYFHKKEIMDKKIIVVDDTIVRGNVIKSIIYYLKEFGAKEVHIRIPAPPVCDICQLGIDIPSKKELLVTNKTLDQVRIELNVDSINYLDCKDLDKVLPKNAYKECFGGGIDKRILEYKNIPIFG